MSTTLPRTGANGGAPSARSPHRGPRRSALAGLLVGVALAGGAAGAGVALLVDQDTTSTTTVIQRTTTGGTTTALDAGTVFETAAAGVVEITATGAGSSQPGPFGGATQSTATGTGFVVDDEGTIVTAAHVVDDATEIEVAFADGTTRAATVSGSDDATDVAVLAVDPGGLTLHPLTLGDSGQLGVGDAVAAVGSPFGYEQSISTGIVSGLDRTIEAPNGFTVAHAIQTDAALNPGNSGGPILDANARVIGIADQIATSGSAEQSSGVGFAVPIDLVAGELDALKAGRTVAHAYLGVSTAESSDGALVAAVTAGGPAAAAGLKAGDLITAVDGDQVSGSSELVAAVAAREPGDEIELTISRSGETRTLTVALGTQPSTRTSE